MWNFKIKKFDKCEDIWAEMCPNDEIINVNKDVADCYWQRNVPLIITPKFLELERKRLRQGAFIYIKDELFWLPPQYYFFLQ